MTLYNSSIFQPVQKFVKYFNSEIDVVNGSNVVSNMTLCGIKVPYEQYQRLSVQIPAGQVDFVLSFAMLGLKPTFITLKPSYSGINPANNYLKWKFQPETGPKWSLTNIMTLTGTSTTPVPNILIDNPDPDCPVQLDILVTALTNDYLGDIISFEYLSDLLFTSVHTHNDSNTGILEVYDSSNQLAISINVSDIINVSSVSANNRIIIDESSSDTIILDFASTNDMLQALSAINWLLLSPATRSLPQPADTTPPVITYSNKVNIYLNPQTMDVDLSAFGNNYTRQDFITDAIASVIDARDGAIVPNINNITITDSNSAIVVTITTPGTYAAVISITDIAGNNVTDTVYIEAQATITDTTPPVINHTGAVTGSVISDIDLSTYNNVFSYNDAKVLCISYVTDDVDGIIPLSSVAVIFYDNNGVVVSSPITTEGHYKIRFTVNDAATNSTTELLTVYIDDPVTDSAPEITFTSSVNATAMTATISLSTDYGSGAGIFTHADAIAYMIQQVFDDVDGIITLTGSDVTFLDPSVIPSITLTGSYTVRFTVTDTALNTTIKNITLTVNP